MSALRTAISAVTGVANRQAIDARLVDGINEQISFMRRVVKFHLPEDLYSLADEYGVPYYEGLPTQHPHAFHRIQFRTYHLLTLPTLCKVPTTILQMKTSMFDEVVSRTSVPLTLNNCVLDADDYRRFEPDTLNPRSPNCWSPILTPNAFFCDVLQMMTPSQVYSLFRENPALQIASFRCIIPVESLYQDFSSTPDLYQFSLTKDTLTYYCERDRSRPYKQPRSATDWLFCSEIQPTDGGAPLFVRLTDSANPWHTFTVSRAPFLAQSSRSYRGVGLVELPQVRRRKVQSKLVVSHKLFRSLYLYARTVSKHQKDDLYAKVRQDVGVLTSECLPLDTIDELVHCVEALIGCTRASSMQSKIHMTLKEDLWYYTCGGVLAHTVDRYRRRHYRAYYELIRDLPYNLDLPTIKFYVSADRERVALSDGSVPTLPWWQRLFFRYLTHSGFDHKTHERMSLGTALTRLYGQSPRPRCPFVPAQLAAAKAKLRNVYLARHPREAPRPRLPFSALDLQRVVLRRPEQLRLPAHARCAVPDCFRHSQHADTLCAGGQPYRGFSHAKCHLCLSQPSALNESVQEVQTPLEDYEAACPPVLVADDLPSAPANDPTPPPPVEESTGTDIFRHPDPALEAGVASLIQALEREHDCADPLCPSHAGPTPERCSSGYPARYTGPCHACPAYADGTAIGGASSLANYIVSVPAARRNYALAAQPELERGLADSDLLNTAFPRTKGKRHNNALLKKLQRVRYMWFPVTEEDCLLRCVLSLKPSAMVDHQWEVLHRFSTVETRRGLMRENSMLNHFHLEVLCLYYHLNVYLAGDLPHGVPRHYGVNEGPQAIVQLEHQHFSVLDVQAPALRHFRARIVKEKHRNDTNAQTGRLVRALQDAWRAQDKQTAFMPYTVSWERAEAYVRSLRAGTTGTLKQRFGEDYCVELEAFAEARGKGARLEVQVAIDTGDGGNGKSYPVTTVLRNKRWHRDHLFQFITPSVKLNADTALKLGLRDPCEDGKGTPSHFNVTFEKPLEASHPAAVLVVDEISKYPPGYVDLVCCLNTMVTHVVMLGDPKQNSWHEPNSDCALNDGRRHMPEDQHFLQYTKEYIWGTKRNAKAIANFMNIPTTSEVEGEVLFTRSVPPGYHQIVPATKMVLDISAVQAQDADTSGTSQGKDWPNVAVIINPTIVSFFSVHNLWTAVGRAKERLAVVFMLPEDPTTIQRLSAIPILHQCYLRLVSQGVSHPTIDWFGPMEPKMSVVMDRIRLPKWPWTNLDSLDWGLAPIMTNGGRRPKFNTFDDLPAMTKVFYRHPVVESCPDESEPADDTVDPPFHATASHAPRINKASNLESLVSLVQEKYSRELQASGTYSQQFPDRPMADRAGNLPRSSAGLRPDGTVDPLLISLHHTLKADDKASTAAGIAKRITLASREDNQADYDAVVSNGVGEALWRSLCELLNLDPEAEGLYEASDDDLHRYQKEHEDNRRATKTLAMLARKEPDAEPERHHYSMQLGFKQEVKVKLESEGTEAKASQTLVTVHDYMLMRFGKIGRYLADKVLSQLPPHIYLHLKRSPAQLDQWCKRLWRRRSKQLINDYTAFDQGQTGAALYLELRLMRYFGVPRRYRDEYFESKIGAFSWLGHFAIMRFTGEFGTFLFNSLYNMAYANLKYDLTGMTCAFGGDDSAFNGVPVQRASWADWEPLLVLTSKEEITDKPIFVSWYLTEDGVYKSPRLLLTRYLIHQHLGDLHKVVMSYYHEFAFAARLFDKAYLHMTPDDMDAHSQLCSVFFRRQRLPKSIIYDSSDKQVLEAERTEQELIFKQASDVRREWSQAVFDQMDGPSRRLVTHAIQSLQFGYFASSGDDDEDY